MAAPHSAFPSSRTHSQPVFPSLPCRQEVLWDWLWGPRDTLRHRHIWPIKSITMWSQESCTEDDGAWHWGYCSDEEADHKYQSLLLMKICVEGLNAMVDGFCFVFWSYIFVPDISSFRIARVATSSTLADLTKSALVRHIKKKNLTFV